jgi:large subunit ribosomal protein L25
MILKVTATSRTIEHKKSVAKDLRKTGKIPAVIYGGGEEAKHITLDKADFMKSYKKSIGETALFYLNVDGSEIHAIIKDRQMHPVTREILHVDFLELHAGKPITLDIPIAFHGDAIGIKEGGNLDTLLRKLPVHCLPRHIPEAINVDVSNLKIGDSIHIGDIKVENVTFSLADDVTVVIVHAPKKSDSATETDDSVESETE